MKSFRKKSPKEVAEEKWSESFEGSPRKMFGETSKGVNKVSITGHCGAITEGTHLYFFVEFLKDFISKTFGETPSIVL